MVIGVCTFELHLDGIQSLKSKRRVLKSLKTRISNKFNVSVSEVDHLETWQRSTIAVAVVSKEQRFANQVLSKVSDLVASDSQVMLIGQKMLFL